MTTRPRLRPLQLGARLVGGEIDAPLLPVLGVLFLQSIVESALTSFLGLWALRKLGASQVELGAAFTAAAIAGVVSGYAGGRLSDRIGRRRPMLAASAALPLATTALGFVGHRVLAGLAVMVLVGAAGGVLLATGQALLTDLVPAERHEHAFASARVVQNLGLVGGPLIGALLLTIGWLALFIGAGVVGVLAFLVALQAIPRPDASLAVDPDEPGSPLRTLLRDPAFVVVFFAGTLAATVYLSYETLLPISLVQSHGVAPAAWGLLLSINPIVVVLFQIRLTARVGAAHELVRIAVGLVAMGTPFLLVAASTAVPLLILMLLLFVLGEMLWVPPSQGLIARLAPESMRGAYLGASSGIWPIAFALGPLLGLQIRSTYGDTAMWGAVAIVSALAIVLYGVANQLAGRNAERSRRPAPPLS